MNPEVNKDGTKKWYKNGIIHREDGPAMIWSDGSELWYHHDKLHHTNGPAIIWADGLEEWWVDDKCYQNQNLVEWALAGLGKLVR